MPSPSTRPMEGIARDVQRRSDPGRPQTLEVRLTQMGAQGEIIRHVPVQLSGLTIEGALKDGDAIAIDDWTIDQNGIWHVDGIHNLRTGARLTATQVPKLQDLGIRLGLGVWFLFFALFLTAFLAVFGTAALHLLRGH